MPELDDLFDRARSEVAGGVHRPDPAELRARGTARRQRRKVALALSVVLVLAGGLATAVTLVDGKPASDSLTPATLPPPQPTQPAPEPAEATPPDTATTGDSGLEDGTDLGFLTYIRDTDGQAVIGFDRVDMLTGATAEAAAAAVGEDVSNDYFLRNDNPRVRQVPLAPDVMVAGSILLNPDHGIDLQPRTLNELRGFFAESPQAATTVFRWTVQNGVVTEIHEQYRP